MEGCQEQMTELRKERIEVNRELKRMFVSMFVVCKSVSFVYLTHTCLSM